MKIVALETSHVPGSVALLDDDHIVYTVDLPATERTSQSFALVCQRALNVVGWTPTQVDLFAVARGPGSFTGLRIGITAAKLFGYVTGCRVMGLDTCEIIAAQTPASPHDWWVTLDAQRRQIYVRRYRTQPDAGPIALTEGSVVDPLAMSIRFEPHVIWTGSGLSAFGNNYPEGMVVTDRDCWTPKATTLGQLAHVHAASPSSDTIWSLVPRYHRASAAEEKAAETRSHHDQ